MRSAITRNCVQHASMVGGLEDTTCPLLHVQKIKTPGPIGWIEGKKEYFRNNELVAA